MKKISILLLIFLFILAFEIMICPLNVKASLLSDTIQQGSQFTKNASSKIDQTTLKERSNDIFNVLLTIGVVITVGVGGVLGIKFMIASAEDKAKLKEGLMPYIAGCIVIYGAFGIWKLVILLLDKVT